MSARRTPAYQSDPVLGAVAISYGGGNQSFTVQVRGFHIDTAGALKVDMANGETVTFATLTAGVYYPYAITKIYQTGSTAAGFVLY